jgi:hypothetical protein
MPGGKTLLDWQLARLPGDRYLYISRAEYEKSELAKIIALKKRYPLKDVWIKKKTNGPLDGLWHMRKYLNVDEELLIAYNDELIEQETLLGFVDLCSSKGYKAGIVCFDTPNERFTRVPGTNDLSAGCTYYFRSGKLFVNKARSLPKGAEDGVPSVVYSCGEWCNFILGQNEHVELGTSEEYRLWAAQQGMTREEMGF